MNALNKFTNVFGEDGKIVRGLWKRNNRYYAQLRLPGRRNPTKLPLKKHGLPVRTLADACFAYQEIKQWRDNGQGIKEPAPWEITVLATVIRERLERICKAIEELHLAEYEIEPEQWEEYERSVRYRYDLPQQVYLGSYGECCSCAPKIQRKWIKPWLKGVMTKTQVWLHIVGPAEHVDEYDYSWVWLGEPHMDAEDAIEEIMAIGNRNCDRAEPKKRPFEFVDAAALSHGMRFNPHVKLTRKTDIPLTTKRFFSMMAATSTLHSRLRNLHETTNPQN